MNSATQNDLDACFENKRVVVVGSGPTVLNNEPGFIDGHDVVVRVNNYKTGAAQGYRADVHYSFYGTSCRKTAAELKADGVRLCICKCPNAQALESAWHVKHGKMNGIDFRYIYRNREAFWFCKTYIPTVAEFLQSMSVLDGHIPTTGFAAILKVLESKPASLYVTGFDFFKSGLHNVDEKWRPGDPNDPIRHMPEKEKTWLKENVWTD